jgi:small subunit ribosomal protein S20
LPHTRSAKKRLRQNATHQARNKAVKTHLKTRVKKFDAAIAAGDLDGAKKQALLLQKSFDRAVTHGIIHRNRAGRKKSITANKLAALLRTKAAS